MAYIIAIVLILNSCYKKEIPKVPVSEKESIKEARILHFSDVYKDWEINTKSVIVETEDEISLEEVIAKRYIKGKHPVRFMAEKAVFNAKRSLFYTIGPTRIFLSPNDEILTEDVNYDESRNLVYSNKLTQRVQGNIIVKGSGFVADANFDEISINNPTIIKR